MLFANPRLESHVLREENEVGTVPVAISEALPHKLEIQINLVDVWQHHRNQKASEFNQEKPSRNLCLVRRISKSQKYYIQSRRNNGGKQNID